MLTPELSRPAKRVRLGRLVMRATVNPKPVARNGSGRLGSTEEWSASLGQVEASKGRSRQRRKSESHEAILCRAARTRCVRSGVKRSRETSASGCVSDRSVPKPTALQKSPHHRSRQHHHSYPRITPELSRPAKRVRLGRLVMHAKVNPKPTARNGSRRKGSTD